LSLCKVFKVVWSILEMSGEATTQFNNVMKELWNILLGRNIKVVLDYRFDIINLIDYIPGGLFELLEEGTFRPAIKIYSCFLLTRYL